jgi:hypothetical protein
VLTGLIKFVVIHGSVYMSIFSNIGQQDELYQKKAVFNAQALAFIPFGSLWHPSRDGAGV